MNDAIGAIIALLIWPGLLVAALLAWFFMWLSRKAMAWLQGRQGPPFYQPFFDFVKLMGKRTVLPSGVNRGLFFLLPVVALVSIVGALALLPVPGTPAVSFTGDLILLLYLLEMPALIDILAGYVTRSPYAQVGAAREAVLMLGYNLPFLTALIAVAVATGSTRVQDMFGHPLGPVQILAALALLLAMPARMKTTPFSIPNAEQEIVAGPHLEYNGVPLGIFELVHGLEVVALSGLFAALFTGPISLGSGSVLSTGLALLLYLAISIAVVIATTLLAAATARLKVQHALRFYWRWGAAAALVALVAALIW